MFKITVAMEDGVTTHTVAHYVTGDPNPTPTERKFNASNGGGPEAWVNAFGRAAKQSVMQKRAETVRVETIGEPRTFTVLATEVME